ncbi:MAG: DUF4838 domain-containing protein [Anaerolineae bacterium]|nr:DUF4838 domain-containing protein [Anaerolineae bacterium]
MAISHVRWLRSGTPDADAVLAYAGRELARYVRRLTGERWDVRSVNKVTAATGTLWLGLCNRLPAPPDGALTPAPWDDGYAIWQAQDGLIIAGRNARSVLFGVYAFLEGQGVRFIRPGRDGEVIPNLKHAILPDAPIVEEPRYRHRGVCIEGAPSLAHALGMVDWCAKKRLNTVFLQFLTSRFFYNQWYERAYNPQYAGHALTDDEAAALDDRVIAALKRRGLVFHRVGHGWTSAAFGMPRSGWVKAGNEEVRPEYVRWLAQVNGKRRLYQDIPINTELCYSHRPAFNAFVENIVRYAEAHPELDVVHVWLSDATNNKCECGDCRALTISDWYAKIINALSEALHWRAPKMRFVFLCYIELLWPPEQVKIDERYGNAILMFAPIHRCFGHGLADAVCDDGQEWPRPPLNQFAVSRHNAFYLRTLRGWRQAFSGDSFDFDYHLMWAVWQQLTDTAIARVIHEDLQHLKAARLNGLISCQPFRAFYPSGLAMATLAESLWNPDVAWDEVRGRYLEAAYGEDAAFAKEYLARVESFLDDTGDPHQRTLPFSNATEEKLAACAAFLATALAEIASRRRSCADKVRRLSLDLLLHHARLLQFIVKVNRARVAGKPEIATGELERAAAFLRRTEPRYNTWLDTLLCLRVSLGVYH